MITKIEREVIFKMFSISQPFSYTGQANIEGYFMGWLSCSTTSGLGPSFYTFRYLDLIKNMLYVYRD